MDIDPPERGLLVEALGLEPAARVTLLSREPLGEGSVAGFDVTAGDGGTVTYFVDTSRRVVARETGMLAGSPDDPDVRVWVHPADPHLPAFAAVAFAHAAESLLGRLGIEVTGAPELVVYRAGRRGVLRIPTADGTTWVKAVPPSRVVAIVDAHRVLARAGVPVPRVRGWSEDGVVVWDAASGTPAPDAAWTPASLLDAVDELRARIASVPLQQRARTRLERRLDWYDGRLQAVLAGEQAALASDIVRQIRADWRDEEPAGIHGDLHFGQLFLGDDDTITGVIDVDTAGEGAPSDDTAAFLAHAVASALLTPAPRDARVWELARLALDRWDAPQLRARAATHLLGHALGAVELGERDRADRMLRLAASVSRGDLTDRPGA